MKRSMEFELAWQGLKLGEHIFDYQLNSDFLAEQGEIPEDVKEVMADVTLKFEKHASFFELHFDIGGEFWTLCDRCGDELKMQLWDEFDLIVKLSDTETAEEMEEDADVVFIPRSETVLDIRKWLYEFTVLSIPLQRIHADKADGTSGCNEEVLKLLGQLAEQPQEKKNDIWKGLESVKINKNNNKHKNK